MEHFQVRCKNQEEWSYILELYGDKGYKWFGSSIPLNEHIELYTFLQRGGMPHKDDIIYIDSRYCLITNTPINGVPLFLFEEKFPKSSRELTLSQAREIIYSD